MTHITNTPAKVNRLVLAVLGLVLIAFGTVAVVAATGQLQSVFTFDRSQPILGEGTEVPSWVFALSLAIAIVFGLIALRWLVAQIPRQPASRQWTFGSNDRTGKTTFDSSIVADAMEQELEKYNGVTDARVSVSGSRSKPDIFITLRTERNALVTDLHNQIASHALPRAQRALEQEKITVHVLYDVDVKPAAHRAQ